MSYEGLVFFRQDIDGEVVEIAELTNEELTSKRSGLAGRLDAQERFWIKDHSHWNPTDFFNRYADELEHKAKIHRKAAEAIRQRIAERGKR